MARSVDRHEACEKGSVVRRDLEDLYKRNLDDLRVSDLPVAQGREWNAEILSRLFPEEEKTLIG